MKYRVPILSTSSKTALTGDIDLPDELINWWLYICIWQTELCANNTAILARSFRHLTSTFLGHATESQDGECQHRKVQLCVILERECESGC